MEMSVCLLCILWLPLPPHSSWAPSVAPSVVPWQAGALARLLQDRLLHSTKFQLFPTSAPFSSFCLLSPPIADFPCLSHRASLFLGLWQGVFACSEFYSWHTGRRMGLPPFSSLPKVVYGCSHPFLIPAVPDRSVWLPRQDMSLSSASGEHCSLLLYPLGSSSSTSKAGTWQNSCYALCMEQVMDPLPAGQLRIGMVSQQPCMQLRAAERES